MKKLYFLIYILISLMIVSISSVCNDSDKDSTSTTGTCIDSNGEHIDYCEKGVNNQGKPIEIVNEYICDQNCIINKSICQETCFNGRCLILDSGYCNLGTSVYQICKNEIISGPDSHSGSYASICKCTKTDLGKRMEIIFSIVVLTVLLIIILHIWMLLDCIFHEFKDKDRKTNWLILLIFIGPIASIFYFFKVWRKKKY